MSTLPPVYEPAELNVIFKFFTKEIADKDGNFTEEDHVKLIGKGENRTVTEYRISRVKKSNPQHWEAMKSGYEAWKEGREEPLEGISLRVWPGCSRAEMENMFNFNIRTVEEVAALGDSALEKMPPGSRAIVERAKTFLEAQNDVGAVMKKVTVLTDENEALYDTIEKLEERMAELENTNKALRTEHVAA